MFANVYMHGAHFITEWYAGGHIGENSIREKDSKLRTNRTLGSNRIPGG